MLNNEIDLTYYININASISIKKNKVKYIFYGFTVPKRLLDDNEIDKPLLKYRIGNWKTKEIFQLGKLIINSRKDGNIQYYKYIPTNVVNKLKLNKYDIARIRLENDIIWLEKIDNITKLDISNLEQRFITRIITRKNNYNYNITELCILFSMFDKSHNIKIKQEFIYLDLCVYGKKYNQIKLTLDKDSFNGHLYLTKEIQKEHSLLNGKYLCSLKNKTLTIEKFLDQLGKKDEL